MESEYQNCVSEFDLNVLDQIINAYHQTTSEQCPEAWKHSLSRIRRQMKDNSKAIYKAIRTNELFLTTKSDLIITAQELEDTRNLLFEKNEQYKVICDERSKYFQQVMEYSDKVENLTELLKKFGDLEYDIKLKDKIIDGYIDQMKAFKTEMDNVLDDKRLKEKNASLVLKQTKAKMAVLEKKFIKALKEYIAPNIKKRDKWVESHLKKYVLESFVEDVSNKVDEQDEGGDNHGDSSIEEDFSKSILNRNTSLDFDCIGSVDTGRGSSLALSDGGKSFHSPDYYMNGSPPATVSNICNKCNFPKSDASTSPIPLEESRIVTGRGSSLALSDGGKSFHSPDYYMNGSPPATVSNICNKCNVPKSDASTSPIPLEESRIETGRGSSLALSDGGKSFHSPDYYMNGSPPATVSNICNKCNFPKLDAFTSPIPVEESGIADNAANRYNEPILVSKKDVCTSPVPSQMLDVASNTTDDLTEILTPKPVVTSEENNTKVEQRHIGIGMTNEIRRPPTKMECVSSYTEMPSEHTVILPKPSFLCLQDFTFDTDDEDMISNASRIASPVEELHRSPVPIDEADIDSQMSSKDALAAAVKPQDNDLFGDCDIDESLDNNNKINNHAVESSIISSHNKEVTSINETEEIALPKSIKLRHNTIYENDDEVTNDFSPIRQTRMFSPIDFDQTEPCTMIASNGPSTIPVKRHETPHLNRKSQEIKCLELNNSNNCSDDVETDNEIRTILDKMRLSYQIVTPIPPTPLGRMRTPTLPRENSNAMFDQVAQLIAFSILSKDVDILRAQFQKSFAEFFEKMKNPEQIPQNLRDLFSTISQQNEDLFRNLLGDPSKKYEKHSYDSNIPHKPYNAQAPSNKERQPDLIDLNTNSMLCITETNEKQKENEASSSNNFTIIDEGIIEEGIEEDEIPNVESGSESREGIFRMDKEHSTAINNKTSLLKAEKIKFVASQAVVAIDNSFSNHHALQEKSIQEPTDNRVEYNTITQIPAENTATTSSAIESKKSIVYEGNNLFGDSDSDDTPIAELNDTKKKRKSKKLSKLETMRVRMLPKSKIKNDIPISVRKLRSKVIPLTPINITTKRRVKESDSAASLNEKSVYDNAVRVLNALKKEPRIVIEDCVLHSPEKSKINTESSDKNNKSQSPTEKETIKNKRRKLSENLDNMPEPCTFASNKSSSLAMTTRGNSSALVKKINDNSPKTMKQKANISDDPCQDVNTRSRKQSGAKMSSMKSRHEAESPTDYNETPKRKRPSVNNRQSPNPNSKSDNNLEPDSPRILRSSHSKCNKETGLKETPTVAETHNIEYISSGRKPRIRIARQKTDQNSQSAQALNISTASEISATHNNKSLELTVDISEAHEDYRVSKKSRSVQIEIPKNNNKCAVSYEDLSLFSHDSTEVEMEVQQKELGLYELEKYNSLRKTHRMSRHKTDFNSESTHTSIDPPGSSLSLTNKKKNDGRLSYADLNLFSINEVTQDQVQTPDRYRKDSFLCRMIQKYGILKIKFIAKPCPESKVTQLWNRLDTSLTDICKAPHGEVVDRMRRLVAEIRTWNVKHFIQCLLKFLRDPARKLELFNKTSCPPCPPMTKKEQVLLYVFDELQKSCDYMNIVQKVLANIEYALLAINKKGESFDAIEAMSHFYALLCRSYQRISQLRLFIIDAMYCLQLKSVVLVQQCLEVWMFVLPLGHMGLAKCPLVMCLVYLLHFYKCDDKHNKVQEIRNTLRYKYNYDLLDWNENMILDMFKTALLEMKDSPMERKSLRLSLLILAKRSGAKWCQTNIVTNMLQPLISASGTPERTRRFCVSLLGPLVKPYPGDMKVHCEMVINYLMDMLHKEKSTIMQEDIISSLMFIDKNNTRFHQFLAKWCPKEVSPEFELIFRDYVRSKSLQSWKQILSWKV